MRKLNADTYWLWAMVSYLSGLHEAFGWSTFWHVLTWVSVGMALFIAAAKGVAELEAASRKGND